MERNRPPSPSTTTLWSRETLEAEEPSSKASGRTPAYVYTTWSRVTRGSGRAGRTAPSKYSTSSRVAQSRSGSPSKSVSVVPTMENWRHGITKIIRSSAVER